MTRLIAVEGARLTEVTIPDSVTTIDSVFSSDSCIKTIHLGASATPWLIRSVWGVENYTVSEENETMCAVDGVIFSKDKTTILYYPSGRKNATYTIPEGVTAIDSSAFGNCWNLTGLVLPASFGEITKKIYNYYLKTFTIPAEITYIAPKTIGYDWEGKKVSNITIIGTSGSAAETYALENGFTFRKLGALGAETAGGSCGAGVTWSLQGTTLVISGTGAMDDYRVDWETYQTDAPWEGLFFDTVVVEPGITHIGNNAFCVMGWDDSTEFTVTLPEGLVSIGERAFFSRYALKTITLPESLESVGVEAFAWTSISNLYLPGNLETIEESAFGGLSLDTIAVSPENSQFCVEDGMLLSADKTRLLAVGSKICDVRIADSIRKVDGYALDGADSMLSLHIGAGVTSLGQYQIMIQGQRLESITVSQNNPVFSAQDGVLFNKSGSELLVYPKCKPEAYYVVPSNVVTIAQAALGGVYILRELVLSPSMKELQPYGISCNTLERVVIPANIKTIGEQAIQFYDQDDYQNLTIVGAKNSAAQTFAKKIGCKFEVLDANNCPHILMLVPGREATFENEGCKEHYACTQCGQLFEDAEGTKKLTLQDVTLPKLRVEGATGVCGDNLTWKFTKGVFTISGTGAMWSYGYNYDEAAGTISTAAPWANFGIKKVVVEEGVTEIGSYAFIGFSTLTAVELPSTLEAVGESAFDSCNLKSLTLPENLQRLGNYAFFANFSIKGTLEIPASLTEIQADALSANNITAFEVDPANPALRSVGGAVYSEDLTVLYAYPSGVNGTWTVADGVETIQESALVYYGGTSGKPTILSIPESVETVCGMSWDWPSLKTILYGGTLAQWEALVEKTQRSYWVYLPENVTVVASDGANNAYRVTYENIFDDVINPNPPIGEFNKALTLKNPTRPGYTFAGWYYEEDFSGKKVTSIPKTNQEDVTLYAKWTPISYTIAFNGNGSKSGKMANLAVNYDEEQQLTANAFVRPGYTFVGWNTAKNGTGADYGEEETVLNLLSKKGTITLYAQWVANTYTIHFDANGGEGEMDDVLATYDQNQVLPEGSFTQTGKMVSGWNTQSNGKGKTYKAGAAVKNLATGAEGDESATLYAVWGTAKYTVTFDPNGASGKAKTQTMTYGKQAALTANSFKRTGYAFTGWLDENGNAYENKQKVENLLPGAGNITLYAQWEPISYTVSLDSNGAGLTLDAQQHSYDESFTLPTLEREGFDFLGWATSKTAKKATYAPEQEVENLASQEGKTVKLYAIWNAHRYEVHFHADEASTGKMKDMTKLLCGKTYTLTGNAFKKTGYTFAGWATEENGSVVYTNKQKVTNLCTEEGAVLDLYAVWTPVEYKITYKNVVSLETAELAKTFNIRDGLELEAPAERPGMAFEGWYLDAKFKTPVEELPILDAKGKVKAANITLYAKWSGTSYKYTIHFEGNGATSGKIADQKGKVNGKEYTLPNCAFKRTGYTFLGWALEAEATEPVFLNKAKVANLAKENGEVITLYAVWKANS